MSERIVMFPTIIVSEQVPEGTILLVPPVEFIQHLNKSTGEVKEYIRFDPKAAGVITNVKP